MTCSERRNGAWGAAVEADFEANVTAALARTTQLSLGIDLVSRATRPGVAGFVNAREPAPLGPGPARRAEIKSSELTADACEN